METRSSSCVLVLSACSGDPLGPLAPDTGGDVTGTASTSPGTPCANNQGTAWPCSPPCRGQVLGHQRASRDPGHAGHSATGIAGCPPEGRTHLDLARRCLSASHPAAKIPGDLSVEKG